MGFVRCSSAGAIVVFTGVVRDNNEGQSVSALEYEAYIPMAQAEMESIAKDILEQIQDLRICAMHRVGKLEIGELAVVCAVSSPHRQQAFEACRLLIDKIKESVPVWKRELIATGAKWIGWTDETAPPRGEQEW
jgi:molybdopterin synthase catalytic subunit